LKVFHLDSERTFRGGERQVLYLIEGLKEKGVENFLFCPENSHLFKDVDPTPRHWWGVDVKKFPLSMRGEFDIFSAIKLSKFIKKFKPHILHSHTAHALSTAIIGKKLSGKNPKIIASRRVDFHIRSRKKYLQADRIIAVSNFVKKVLIEDGIPEEKIDVVYSGIDLADFVNLDGEYLKKEFNIRKDEFIIGNIAALTEQKDHETLLKGVSHLEIDFKLFIVGEGHLRKKLERLSEKLKIKDRVIFTGFRKDARNFLKIFDLFVLTSKWEALGTSILDAMATGVAVVATKTGGISEMIEDGISGFLVKAGDHRDIADKIIFLKKNKSVRDKIIFNAREKVKKFSIKNMVAKTYQIYTGLKIL